ncbi:MAG: hypothetical protein R8L07_06475 [Alphaproteobacteria bacterium]|nr:hypothetical protein [Alphaproteobacteria bacterium]
MRTPSRIPAEAAGPVALRGSSVLLGVAVLALAAGVAATDLAASDLLDWLADTLGIVFLSLLGALCLVAFWAWMRIVQDHPRRDFWLEAGLHAAAAIATLALTFTLLGISLGIGTLAETDLTPETVQQVIARLTEQFSLAFMTSVIGLPVSAAVRALLLLTDRAASND